MTPAESQPPTATCVIQERCKTLFEMNKGTVIITLLLVFISASLVAQTTIIDDSFSIKYKKAKIPGLLDVNGYKHVKIKNDSLIEILIKCRIRTIVDKPIDPNKFSLRDETKKLRYRMSDFSDIRTVGGPSTRPLLKTNIYTRPGQTTSLNWPDYDPTIVDSFYDYNVEGYKNIECPVIYGSRKKPRESLIYFTPSTLNDFFTYMYYAIDINSYETSDLDLYYGFEKIADVKVK